MPIARISGHGLAVITFVVALLWGFVIGERRMERRATVERARVMREIERFQREQQVEPVSLPSRFRVRPVRPTAG